MRRVYVSSLQPGMRVARTIYGIRGEILLSQGALLTNGYIAKLVKHGVPFIYINDGLMNGRVVKDVITEKTRVAAVKQVENILLNTQESGKLVIEPKEIYNTVRSFTGELLSSESLMLNLVDLRTQDTYTFAHSVNVCVLALMTGVTLGYSNDELTTLGAGALLHDLGKVKIPGNILNKPSSLTPTEFEVIKTHTSYGYKLITESRSLGSVIPIIALQHHESYDGSGYPMGISGDYFHEFAQITAIADKFDALTANRVYRKAFPPHEAYEMCAASGNYLFKDRIVRAFLHNISAYPSGSMVQLNSGEIAVVIETPKGYSLLPIVRLIFDKQGNPINQFKELNLSKESGIFVVRVLPEEEIQPLVEKYYFSTKQRQ